MQPKSAILIRNVFKTPFRLNKNNFTLLGLLENKFARSGVFTFWKTHAMLVVSM